MKDQVESVYRTIQTESNDKPDSCRVETTSSNIRKSKSRGFLPIQQILISRHSFSDKFFGLDEVL